MNPFLATTSESPADALAINTYSVLERRRSGPLCMLEVWASTVTLDENRILNTVSIDQVAHAPTPQSNIRPQEKAHRAQSADIPTGKPAKPMNQPHSTDGNEYVVKKISRHVGSGRNTKNTVLWYWYGPKKDMVVPPDHILKILLSNTGSTTQTKILQCYYISTDPEFKS